MDGEHKALNQVPWSMYLAIKILPVYKEPIKLSSLGGRGVTAVSRKSTNDSLGNTLHLTHLKRNDDCPAAEIICHQ